MFINNIDQSTAATKQVAIDQMLLFLSITDHASRPTKLTASEK